MTNGRTRRSRFNFIVSDHVLMFVLAYSPELHIAHVMLVLFNVRDEAARRVLDRRAAEAHDAEVRVESIGGCDLEG